jgi:hypothetical protein
MVSPFGTHEQKERHSPLLLFWPSRALLFERGGEPSTFFEWRREFPAVFLRPYWPTDRITWPSQTKEIPCCPVAPIITA